MKLGNVLLLVIGATMLTGCGGGKSDLTPEEAASLGRSVDSINHLNGFTYQLVSDSMSGVDPVSSDSSNGFIYEKNQPTPKDRLKIAAKEEEAVLQNASAALNIRFGLSHERSYELAKLAVIWATTPKERKTPEALNEMSMQVVGHSVGEIQSAVVAKLSGQDNQLNQIIEDAALMNGISVENMDQILSHFFAQ